MSAPNRCVICDRKIGPDDYVCSDACEREMDRRSDAPGDWEKAQKDAWLTRWDDRDERRRAA